ncbi:MAG: CPBP family intramembrane metalloprotease [Planctomycetes bacterium]|nr:CPBP family intramembrane metalloprotease [Planctomycetota bacterium]
MLDLWRRLPAFVRAVLACLAVLVLGGQPWQVLLALNFQFAPSVPWCVPLGLVWLAIVWSWLRGRGPPASTRAARRASLRAERVSATTWVATLAIGVVGWCGLLLLEIALFRALGVPKSAPFPPELSITSALAFALLAALGAGVIEESAFRGVLQRPLESRHGPFAAITVSSACFLLAHAGQYGGRLDLLLFNAWYYLGAGALFGFLAWSAGSILPGIVLHALADLAGIALAAWSAAASGDPLASVSAWLVPAGLACIAGAAVLGRRRVRSARSVA